MKYLFALFLTLASFGSALADSRDTTVTSVPFDFVIGNKTFPAGTYSISRRSKESSPTLLIRRENGKTAALFFPSTTESSDPNGQVKLQFRHEGDMYFLTGVFGESDTYTVNSRHHHRMAAPDESVVTSVGP
jgi:hypothetical protein